MNATTSKLAEVMEKAVAIVMLRLEGIPGRRQVPNTQTLVNDKVVTTLSTPTLSVLPPLWQKQFASIKTEAENIIQSATPPKPEDGAAILPAGCHTVAAGRLEEIQSRVENINAARLSPLVDRLIAQYDGILDRHRENIGAAAWELVSARMPKAASFKSKISLRFLRLPITFISDAGRPFAEDMAKNIVTGIAETINQEAVKLQEKAAKEGVYKAGSFTNLKRQFQLLRDFSFLASDETLQQLQEIEKNFGDFGDSAVKALNGAGSAEVVANLNKVVSNLGREAAADAGGRFRRIIQL